MLFDLVIEIDVGCIASVNEEYAIVVLGKFGIIQKEKQVPLREPDLRIILTGGQYAYTRNDGVKIIPLGCLKW